jgi:Zn-dependent protease
MAIRRGIPVLSITLFIFGGVAQIADEPDRPATEFLIAIMGPLMSAALAAVFGAVWIWLRIINSASLFSFSFAPAILLFGILAQANLALAVFNLAPGFPLDGGRVFRAALWGWWHDVRRATLWASRAGQVIAVIFVAVGGWLVIHDGNFGGVWYGLIAIFLWNAAREGYRHISVRETLKNIRVEQIMLSDVKTIAPDLSLADFVGHYLAHYRDPAFAVADATGLRGLVSGDHIRRFARAEWHLRRVSDAMTPIAQLAPLSPSDNAATALARLMRSSEPELPVLDDGNLVGVLGETEIYRFLKLSA